MDTAAKGLPGPSTEGQLAQDAQHLARAVRRISVDLGAAADILDRVAVAAGATMADAITILASSPPVAVAGAVQNAVNGLPVARANASGTHANSEARRKLSQERRARARLMWERDGIRDVTVIAQRVGVSIPTIYGYRWRDQQKGEPWLPPAKNDPKAGG